MLERKRVDGQAGRQSGTWKAEESFEVKDSRKQGWFWAYDATFDLDVSEHAKIVYFNLCRRAGKNGNAFSSHARIARDCSISVRTVRRAISELVQVGAIRVQSRKQEGLLNIYHLTDLSEWRGGSATQTYPSATQTYPSATQAYIGIHNGNTYKDSLSKERVNSSKEEDREEKAGGHVGRQASKAHPEQPGSSNNHPIPLVRRFYTDLGQPRISRQRLEEGVKILTDLGGQGFSYEEIAWGMEWIMKHREQLGGEVYSLRLLPKVIGQALKEAEEVKKAQEKKRQQEEEERRLREGLTRHVALEELYLSLPAAEQASLREKAQENLIQQGIQKAFLVEALVRNEVYQMLGERGQSLGRNPR